MTNKELDAEFSISITKKAGEPQMDFKVSGEFGEVFSALIAFLSDLTLRTSADVDAMTEMAVAAYRGAVVQRKKASEKL